ncbi:hypothetical protein E2C01_089046 [Portunus trituberculatus]|uniref:Uncharacterized protein n=1 Tax=Portunus trituberculatus TaxID=210409 RepID=A0A5B7JAY5_PORTR|nr:hypothetical protein [Portunus trituberculatus]
MNQRTFQDHEKSLSEKKLSFPHRTMDIWNGLSEEIVIAETSIYCTKI